jgi:UDP-2-acetamido-3-amino-2,3-dideoxy-glucuronate N-acetyltransferase
LTAKGPRVALVGCGHWGANIARNLAQMGSLGLICDSSLAARRRATKDHPRVPVTADLRRALDDPAYSAVAIAAPAEDHYRIARHALLAGKDVFVEKPLALTTSEAEDLEHVAARRRRILMVGHILNYHPAILKLKEFVDSGDLGEIQYVYSNRLNLGRVREIENALWSFAPHDISVILLLLGRLPRLVASHGQHYVRHRVPDTTMSYLTFAGKARAHIYVSWLHPYKEQKLVVVGSRKMVVFDDAAREGKLQIYDQGIEWRAGRPLIRQTSERTLYFGEIEPLREELEHFVECIRFRRRPRTDGANGVRVLRVLEACQRSIEKGGAAVGV